jgi:hypothetical protein
MRLGFDLDGTVADLQAALAREAGALFPGIDPSTLPRSLSPDSPGSTGSHDSNGSQGSTGSQGSGGTAQLSKDAITRSADTKLTTGMLSARQQRELWDTVCARVNFWETLDEIEPGALARLWRLATERKWEVIFLTSRPESAGDTAQIQSHRWLSAHGFRSPSVFVVHGSRGKIASALALDALVDDRPENCLDVAIDSSARPILVWRGNEGKVPGSARQLGIGAVGSIAECLDILELLDRPDAENVGMIERFKRLLGLKPKPARLRGGGALGESEAAAVRESLG